MSRQARTATAPETALRRMLHSRGLRYRVHHPLAFAGMPRRRADIVFTKKRIVVFVDGCFWHACPEHGTSPKSNATWWAAKLARNVERDRETDRALSDAGWTVVRVWEHEPTIEVAAHIEELVGRPARR